MKNVKWLLIFPVGFGISLINTCVHSRDEYRAKLSFTISKVEVTPTRSLSVFNKAGEQIHMWNYNIRANKGVIAGDSIYKGECSEILHVFKKDMSGKYIPYIKVNPTGLFPLDWFCNDKK